MKGGAIAAGVVLAVQGGRHSLRLSLKFRLPMRAAWDWWAVCACGAPCWELRRRLLGCV